MNQNALTQALIRQIVARTRCTTCGHHFGPSDVRVIGRRDKTWVMSMQCRECRTQALVLAVVNDGVAQSFYTDLLPDEWERVKARPPNSTNDVIEFYRAMEAYDGDFSEIMDEPLPPEI